MLKKIVVFLALAVLSSPLLAGRQLLDVPLVRQTEGRLCGPASIEMVYRYWGEKSTDQFAIASEIASEYSTEKRFLDSDYVANRNPDDYPGTPAYIMRKFLTARAATEKYSLKKLPANSGDLDRKFDKAFAWIKNQIDSGIPVITHQYWKSNNSTGHYRVVTGYDDSKRIVYLNDAKLGKIVQSYSEFKKKGAYKGKWMPYYSIAFNVNKVNSPL